MTNGALAELLARAAEGEEGHRARALRRASRSALTWPEEAEELAAAGRSLTELRAVGPWVSEIIRRWIEDPPDPIPQPPAIRAGFMTMAEARAILVGSQEWRPRADLQMHTRWSDGRVPLEDMVRLAAERGYEHVSVTDHSKGLPIARGMDEATLLRQGEVIDRLNRQLAAEGSSFRVLRSIEMNLSPTGEGDMDPDVLRTLDLVLGAFHSQLRVTEDQTERYLAALGNSTVHVLAHPRGRRWGTRPGLRADWPRVAEAAADAGVALEIDAFPDRQDLELGLLPHVRDAGGWVSIGTDAHRPEELAFIDLGLAAAARARIPRDRILNFLTADELREWAGGRGASDRR